MSSVSRPQEVRPIVLMVGDGEAMALRLRTAMSWHGLALVEAIAPTAIQAIHTSMPDLVFLVGDAAKDGGEKLLEGFAIDPVASHVRAAVLSDDIGLLARERSFTRLIGVVPRSGSSDAIGRRVGELAREAKAAREKEAEGLPKVDTRQTEIDALSSARDEMDASPTGEFMAVEPLASKMSPGTPEAPSKQNLSWQDSAPTRIAPELADKNVSIPAPEIVTKEISIDDEAFEDLGATSAAPPPPPPRPDSKKMAQRTLLGIAPSVPAPAPMPAATAPLASTPPESVPERREPSRSVSLPLEAKVKRDLSKNTLIGVPNAPLPDGVPAPPPWPPPQARASDRPDFSYGLSVPNESQASEPTHAAAASPVAPVIAQPPAHASRAQKKSPLVLIASISGIVIALVIAGVLYSKNSSETSSTDAVAVAPTSPPSPTIDRLPASAAPSEAPPTRQLPELAPPPVVQEPTEVVTPPPTVVEAPAPQAPVPAPAAPPAVIEEAPPATSGLSGDELASRGERALEARDFAAASTFFRQALAADPGNPHAYEGLARLSLRTGARQEALLYAQRAVQVRPRRASYRVLLGDVHQALGDRAQARRAWEEALRVEPGNREARRRLR